MANETKTVAADVDKHMTRTKDGVLLRIGHKLGAYMKYPHHICADGVAGGEEDQNVLMDEAFSRGTFDALELDAQPSPASDRCDPDLYVVHDPLDPELDPARYRNTSLRRLLGHFRDNYKAGPGEATPKRLFIELKPQRTCSGGLAVDYNEALVARRMMDILKDFPEVVGQISLTSFNAGALMAAHAIQGSIDMRYYLIVGARGLKGSVVCWLGSGDVPRFDDKQAILKEPWLTGLWFSPADLADYARVMNGINDSLRKNQPPLKFGLSHYGADSWGDIAETFGPQEQGLKNVEGFVYDVCDKESGTCPSPVDDTGSCEHNWF